MTLLHGTRNAPFQQFDLSRAFDRSPFGPAVYLTADLGVAWCYLRAGGGIGEFEVSGPASGILDLDTSLDQQPANVIAIVEGMLRGLNVIKTGEHVNARAIVELADAKLGKRRRNRLLASLGVWMLQGHLSAMEHGGRCDDGCQYAVLDTSKLGAVRWLDLDR